jgi:hypothetical protein
VKITGDNNCVMPSTTTTTAVAHNGPICHTCSTPYLGQHACDPEALVAKARLLLDIANRRLDQLADDDLRYVIRRMSED